MIYDTMLEEYNKGNDADMALVSGLHHASLKCVNENEFKRAVDFYKQVLKIAPVRQWEQGIMFDTGCGIIEIFNNGKEKR